jgi:hypothetical protein
MAHESRKDYGFAFVIEIDRTVGYSDRVLFFILEWDKKTQHIASWQVLASFVLFFHSCNEQSASKIFSIGKAAAA